MNCKLIYLLYIHIATQLQLYGDIAKGGPDGKAQTLSMKIKKLHVFALPYNQDSADQIVPSQLLIQAIPLQIHLIFH